MIAIAAGIGALLVLNLMLIVIVILNLIAISKLKNSADQVITNICGIEKATENINKSIVQIEDYLGDDFQATINQN